MPWQYPHDTHWPNGGQLVAQGWGSWSGDTWEDGGWYVGVRCNCTILWARNTFNIRTSSHFNIHYHLARPWVNIIIDFLLLMNFEPPYFRELSSHIYVKMLGHEEAPMIIIPEELPPYTLSQLKEGASISCPISYTSHCVDHIPLPCKDRDGSSSPTPLCPPPNYDSSFLSPGHCSPPPAYTQLSKGENPTLPPSACSCCQCFWRYRTFLTCPNF